MNPVAARLPTTLSAPSPAETLSDDARTADCRAPALKSAAFFGNRETIERVYGQGRFDKVAALTRLYREIIDLDNFEQHADALQDTEVIFSTWGMPALTPAQLDRLPALQTLFYAGGSVQAFARPLLERNITVVSAWQANAVPVAEFTLAQILLATKGYFRNSREFRSPADADRAFRGRGNFGETIALLGAGAIGRKVIELLRPFHLKVVVFDPFLSAEKASELGVEKVSLEDAFRHGYVVSNHLANLPETVHMLHGDLFAAMQPNATFINTGRGATVDEEALVSTLQARADLNALLDVTWPEPPLPGSPLYTMPNVHLSTHIAGSLGDEVVRMADCCIEEFITWCNGQPLRYAVSPEMMQSMA